MAITVEAVTLASSGAADAYYTVSAMARDGAGNISDVVDYTLVHDANPATTTAPAVPGVTEAGKTFDGAAYLNDALSIRDYYGTASYGTVFNLGIGLPITVDAFNAASLTRLNHAVTATVGLHTTAGVVAPYGALQDSPGANLTFMSQVSVFVRDQAQESYGTGMSSPAVPATAGRPDSDDDYDTNAFTVHWIGRGDDTGDDFDVCALPGGCGNETGTEADEEDFPTSLKIEIAALAPGAGTFRNPFERVDFYVRDTNGASWLVASDASGTSSREGGDIDAIDENDRWRVWSYSATLPGAMVAKATRQMTGGTTMPMIFAIAVNENNVGLYESSAVDISTEKP